MYLFLEAHDEVVRVAHDHDTPACAATTPFLGPEIENVVQEDVGEERADYSPNAKGNFSFDRVICDWRTRVAVLDLRLKK